MTVKEAAIKCNVTERTIINMCNNGKIANAVKTGKSWFIPDNTVLNNTKDKKNIEVVKKNLKLPVGYSDYSVVASNYLYIDKTMMIKDIIDDSKNIILFTRPRRFGKTLNMNMLRTFFEKTDKDTSIYFKDKLIWHMEESYKSQQGKYPVIFLSFKDAKLKHWDQTKDAIFSLISEEFIRHSSLLSNPKLNSFNKEIYQKIIEKKASDNDFMSSLALLTKLLNEYYGEKTIIIMDEYDTPILDGYMNNYYNEVTLFMRNFFSHTFKDNPYLKNGFLTGILRVAKESIFSGLNNLCVDTILDEKYSKYFGFTNQDILDITHYYNQEDKIDEIKKWYDGYQFGNTPIFNPWSVVNYFNNNCKPEPYWISTSSNDTIGELLKNMDYQNKEQLVQLLNGESIRKIIDMNVIYPNLKNNNNLIYSFLLATGYLKVLGSSMTDFGENLCEIAIPNKEISFVYRKEIINNLNIDLTRISYIDLQDAMIYKNIDKMKQIISKVLKDSCSYFDTCKEDFYQGLMLGLCALFGNYYVTSNLESGDGRYDIALEPNLKDYPGIIIELKAVKNNTNKDLKTIAKEALKQINDKKYDCKMKNKGINQIYKYGLAFSNKEIEVETE